MIRGPSDLCADAVPAVLGLSVASRCPAAEPKPIWLAVAEPICRRRSNRWRKSGETTGSRSSCRTRTVEAALAALPRRPAIPAVGRPRRVGPKNPRLPAKLLKLYRWRSRQPKEFLSDMAWGDLDGDGIPRVPVGRIPLATPAELERVVRKILAFESQPPSPADLQAAVWLGSSEYNTTIDAVASSFCVMTLQTGGPAWLQPWLISGNADDPFAAGRPTSRSGLPSNSREAGSPAF